MKFEDEEIKNLDLTDVDNVSRLIIEFLCGEKYYQPFIEDDKKLLAELISNAEREGLNYEQFNELLLLLNQDRIGKDFFKFFFEKDKIFLDDLKEGVIKFRSFAMLSFGNFRFAYKQLSQTKKGEVSGKLEPFWKKSSDLAELLDDRPTKMLEVDKIGGDKTWYLGEISGAKINKEAKVLKEEIKKAENGESKFSISELNKFEEKLAQMSRYAEEVQKKALKNTDIYLTWDYMDIYIATSMRNKWEFEETSDFVERVFGDSGHLKKLNLRYFDPTQSKCKNSRDKGLIEGLMLKRALCTIYLAQESDTMGKDSELAATLAQSTPVIAYVPQIEPEKYSEKIKEYPLDFFKKRLLILEAEGIFEEPDCIKKLKNYDINFEETIDVFLEKMDKYRKSQPFSLRFERDNKEFKQKYSIFSKICRILAITESHNFDRRADFLKGRHPLSMQVDLQTGVVNGVLVVRNPQECAELLYNILANNMEFTIKHQKEGFTVLEENRSGSPFRVVTDYERLTNSFWNLFI